MRPDDQESEPEPTAAEIRSWIERTMNTPINQRGGDLRCLTDILLDQFYTERGMIARADLDARQRAVARQEGAAAQQAYDDMCEREETLTAARMHALALGERLLHVDQPQARRFAFIQFLVARGTFNEYPGVAEIATKNT